MKSACSQLLLFLIVLIILVSSSFSSEGRGNNINPDGRKKRSPPPPSPSPPPPPPLPTPDYYLLVLQWPYSFCRNTIDINKCKERTNPTAIPLHLTIHGFWPKMFGGRDPKLIGNQPKREFELNQLPKSSEMEMYWPNLIVKETIRGFSFWIDQWVKHGSLCDLPQKTYFQTAVDGAKPIIKYWDEEIKFTPNSMIDLDLLHEKFEESDYKTPQFVCNEQRVNGQIVKQLHEIRFVWTPAGFHDNVDSHSACTKNVWLPGYVRATEPAM
ncbi:hypothetical protein AQUCO_00200738v1 [Aquilegia coerulea]|uniref:Uncharacterized protein n=1 Tax=Aquilegia coerulea TaxID=218851 RepID=A0A2G5F4M5_AQUCA|nr:hypothetical protein AQUCO_00200734v1 [Aquilegia coerulea]PIA62925.1 hypothetical protein AQUCO_00200738v1 [Aquilegia coerulea]